MDTLILAAGILEEILAHARAGYPLEICGLIAGCEGEGRELYRGQNVARTPETAFEMDATTLARQIDFEERGLALVAVYHSHPHGPDRPSPLDVAQAFYPDAVHIICSLAAFQNPTVKGFRIADGSVWEVRLLRTFDN